jgi:hypothetical protein
MFVGFGLGVRILGPLFVLGFYALLGLHIYTYFAVIIYVLKRRLGTIFGLIWVAIGLSLAYNISYNHFFATFLKPGSPTDLKVNFSQLAFLHFIVFRISSSKERSLRKEKAEKVLKQKKKMERLSMLRMIDLKESPRKLRIC